MDFSVNPKKLQDDAGRSFMVVSHLEGGFVARDETTCNLVYLRESDLPDNRESD